MPLKMERSKGAPLGPWIQAGNKVKRKDQLGGCGLMKEGVTT